MRKILFVLLICALAIGSLGHLAFAAYASKIVVPETSNATLKASAADAAQVLQKMTGIKYSIGTDYSGSGILLARSDAAHAPADLVTKLKGKGSQSFAIRSNDGDRLWIVANADAGLSHGLYYYLEQLGVRFLMPGENWTIVPKRQDATLKIDSVLVPDFRARDFFGTGGYGPKMVVDQTGANRTRWETWKRRNRFGEEYDIGGHTGEAFNAAHKDILMQHPEYLAKVDGKHVPWSLSAKLNVANPTAVKLYVDWSVERYRKQRAEDPNGPRSFAVSVDPADGYAHCNSDECKQIGSGSVSDMVFYVANEVAKAVRREFPDGWVSLLAYNQHAAVPTIDLEPNIYVKVVPYAFQSTGLSPEELIKAWGKKVKRMSIYDYWAITDWAHNQPSFNYLSTPAQKLRLWKQNNFEGYRGESTYSAGAIGLGWYVASRLMWDVDANEKAIIEEFYDLAFGTAKTPMKRMLERWATGYQLNANQMAFAFRDIAEARKMAAGDEAVTARIDDYGRYLHYLRLWYEYQSAIGADAREAAARKLIEFMWDIYDSAMVHTVRTAQVVARGFDAPFRAEFDYKKKDAPFWNSVQPLAHEEISALMNDGLQKYPILFQPAFYDLSDLKPLSGDAKTDEEWVTAPSRFGEGTFAVLRNTNSGPVQFYGGKEANTARVTISRDGETSKTSVEVKGTDWVDIPLPTIPGIYRIQVQPTTTFSYLLRAGPQAFLTALESVEVRGIASATYLYVAPGQKTVALHTPGLSQNTPLTVNDGDGKPVEVQPGLLKVITVPPGQDGKIWVIRGHAGNRTQKVSFLNGPRVYGFSPAGMLVPSRPIALDAPPTSATEPEGTVDGEAAE